MMKKLIMILYFGLVLQTITYGQTINQLFQKADSSYFDYQDYKSAIDLYNKILNKLNPSDKDYNYVVDKIAKSLFYVEQQVREENDFLKSIEYSKEFITIIEKEEKYIDKEIVTKKYWMYKNIVMDYFALGKKDEAKPYQDKLYQAYNNKELPEGINQYYCFEKFVHNNLNVWGYEWFAKLGDKETEGSFSKHVYYIYSRDSIDNDKDLLFTLHTVKIHKLKGDEPDFVLTKRTYNNNQEQSESIWNCTFAFALLTVSRARNRCKGQTAATINVVRQCIYDEN
jgi:tetratricopeptide (TPR) repeat protein